MCRCRARLLGVGLIQNSYGGGTEFQLSTLPPLNAQRGTALHVVWVCVCHYDVGANVNLHGTLAKPYVRLVCAFVCVQCTCWYVGI